MRNDFVHVIFSEPHISRWCARRNTTARRGRAHAARGRIVIMLATRICLIHINILLGRWLNASVNGNICVGCLLSQTGCLTLCTGTTSRVNTKIMQLKKNTEKQINKLSINE